MSARNGPDSFGWVSRALHWMMALALIGMLGLGLRIEAMEPSLSTLWLYGLHKSIGIVLLGAVLMRIVWHRISPPPAPLARPGWQAAAARWTHRMLYALMLALPVCGWVASAATGIDVVLFGRLALPPVAPASPRIEALFFGLHGALSKLLIAAVLLHAGAAVHHAAVRRDRALRRMLRGG